MMKEAKWFQIEDNKLIAYDEAGKKLSYVPPLVFIAEDACGIDVYQYGEQVRGIRSIRIDSDMDEATTHMIEYVTVASGTQPEPEESTNLKQIIKINADTSKLDHLTPEKVKILHRHVEAIQRIQEELEKLNGKHVDIAITAK